MNKLPVYLYSNLLDIILDLDQNRSIHKIMYQRKIKIQKGFKDSVQIQFKNSDQKTIALSADTSYWFDMIDSNGRQLVLTKQLAILDDTVAYSVNQDQTATNTTLTFSDTTGISVGQTVQGFGIPVNAKVIAVQSGTVTLNLATVFPITAGSEVTFNTFNKRGVAVAEFDPIDTINLTAGSYKFVVKQDNGDGTFTPAYSNTYYNITGEVEVVEDGYPIGYPIQTVDIKRLETAKQYDRNVSSMGYVFISEWLRPMVRPTTAPTTSTAIITLAGFTGEIMVEGTLDNNPSPDGQANAQAFTVTNYIAVSPTQGTIELTWSSTFTAVRFRVKPSTDGYGSNYYPTGFPVGSNTNKFPKGFVDQIQYIS